jgi:nitroimidazol reductase NimA-like FMN-containing flavoprotein (pyridoxamine 5'-phosphate oxidase superfamily)
MTITTPTGELDRRFSSEDASPTPWSDVARRLETGETYWITTVREDGRPHSTPLVGVWHDGAFWFCTGESEQKARNLEHRRESLVSVGSSGFEGLDVVVEGDAERVTDEARLARVAGRYAEKYDPPFNSFEVRDGAFHDPQGGTRALVFEVRPTKILAFRKDDPFAQTRFRTTDG